MPGRVRWSSPRARAPRRRRIGRPRCPRARVPAPARRGPRRSRRDAAWGDGAVRAVLLGRGARARWAAIGACTAPAREDVVAGHVALMFADAGSVVAQIDAGRVLWNS